MLRFGLVALSALTFLVSPTQTNAAVRVGPSDSLLHKGVIEPVHYIRRYGWHCSMGKYNHEHREICRRTREGRDRDGTWRRRPFGAGGRPVEN